MTVPYPIVRSLPLGPTPKRGRFRPGLRGRASDELPRPDAHQVLVYRVDGNYVVDDGRLSPTHPQVIGARSVSVVDMRSNAAVSVEVTIPSLDAAEFMVHVVFTCVVTDPVTIVREGVLDAREALESYLRSHHRLFELGLDFPMSQITEVRRSVNAQMRAYTTLSPPIIRGLRAEIASVDVLTPEEVATFERTRRDARNGHMIETDRLGYSHHVSRLQQQGRQQLERNQKVHDHLVQTEDERHHAQVLEQRRGFERRELDEAREAVGTDPRQALLMAFAAGQLSATDLAQRLREQTTHDTEYAERRAALARDDRHLQLERDHQLALRAQDADDDERRLERERLDREAERDRHDVQQQLAWAREDRVREQTMQYERERERLKVNLAVLNEFAKRGHYDMVNVNLEHVMNELIGTTSTALEKGTPAAPTSLADDRETATDSTAEQEDVDGVDIREEDE